MLHGWLNKQSCTNRAVKGTAKHFYRIPKVLKTQGEAVEKLTQKRYDHWIARINHKDWHPSEHHRICSDHFASGKPAPHYQQNNPDWVPSLNMGYHTCSSASSLATINRYSCLISRVKQRHRLKENVDYLQLGNNSTGNSMVDSMSDGRDINSVQSVGCQTDLTLVDLDASLKDLEFALKAAEKDVNSTKAQLKKLEDR